MMDFQLPAHVPFMARLWIDLDVGLRAVSAWVHELDPTDHAKRSGAEWVVEHLQNSYGPEDFREWFGLSPEKCYQVLFKGTLNGRWSGLPGEEEYDEDIALGDFEISEVPQDYFALLDPFDDAPESGLDLPGYQGDAL